MTNPGKQRYLPSSKSWGFCLALMVWAAGALVFLSRIDPATFFSDGPLYQENYAKYFYLADATAKLLADTGKFWGYDPNFAAGLLQNPGGATIAHLLPARLAAWTGLPASLILKLFPAAFFLCLPWLIYAGARRFGLSPMSAAWLMLLDCVMNHYSLRYRSLFAGMGMYYSATPVLLFATSFLAGSRTKIRPYRVMGVAAFFVLLLAYWHVEQAMLLALAAGVHILLHRRLYFSWKFFSAPLIAAGFVIALSWPWLYPFVAFHIQVLPFLDGAMRYMGLDWHGSGAWVFFAATLFQPLMLFSLAGGIFAWRGRSSPERPGTRFLSAFAALLVLVSFLMSLNAMGTAFYAARFLDGLPFLLLVPLGIRLQERWREGGFQAISRMALAALVLAVLQVVVALLLSLNPPYRSRPPEDYIALKEWIEKNTTPEARIAFEASPKGEAQPLGFDPVSLLAMETGRPYVAIPSVESANIYYLAFLYEGRIGPHDLARLSHEQRRRIMDEYNVGWIVALSARTKAALKIQPELFRFETMISDYHIYSVLRPHSYFLAGSGRVEAQSNKLLLTELAPDEEGVIVLSFHYYKSLRLRGDGRLSRRKSRIDGIGFIRIETESRSLEVRNDPASGFPGMPEDYKFAP